MIRLKQIQGTLQRYYQHGKDLQHPPKLLKRHLHGHKDGKKQMAETVLLPKVALS